MNKFTNWLVFSSENPTEASMTIKGLLIANVAVIMYFLHLAKLPYSIEEVTNMIGVFTGFIGSVLAVVGLIRKLKNSAQN